MAVIGAGPAGLVAPSIDARPELFDARIRPDAAAEIPPGRPWALSNASGALLDQMARSPRAPVEPDDVASLERLGLPAAYGDSE